MADDPWGPIDLKKWNQVPCVTGRPATEADVRAGRAVFFVQSPDPISRPDAAPTLPRCALFREGGRGLGIPVVAIQVEPGRGGLVVGYRYLVGGNGVCSIEELEFVDEPDDRFGQQVAS